MSSKKHEEQQCPVPQSSFVVALRLFLNDKIIKYTACICMLVCVVVYSLSSSQYAPQIIDGFVKVFKSYNDKCQ